MVAIPFNSQEGQLQYTACSFVLEVPATECDEQLFIYANLPDYQFEFFDTGKSTCQFIQKCKETFPHLERSQTPSSITNLLSVWEQQNVHIDWILENDPSVLVDKYNMDSAFLNYYDRDEDRVHLLGKFLKRRDQTKIHFTFNCIFELTEDAFLQFPTDHYFSSHSSLQNYQLITINLYDTDASFLQQAYGQTPDYLLTHLSHTHVPLFGTVVAPSLALKDLPQYLPRYVFNRFSCSFVSIHLKSFLSLSGRHDFFVPFSC